MSLNVKNIVEKQIRAILGDPIVDSIPEDLLGVDNAIELASIEYWKAYPHIYVDNFKYFWNESSEKRIAIQTLTDAAFSNLDTVIKDKSYYIGVFRTESFNANELFNNQGMDYYLLGVPTRNRLLPGDYQKALLNKTQQEQIQGCIETRVDHIAKEVIYVMPYAILDVSVYHAFGFIDPDLEFIDPNKVHVFTKMVLSKYLDMLIAVRHTLELQGDYNINVDFLQEKKSKIDEELVDLLIKTSYQPMIV